VEPLLAYIASGRPYLGICLGMQTLFAASEENPGVKGLGLIPATIKRFTVDSQHGMAVPHMGWNGVNVRKASPFLRPGTDEKFYFVHSFLAESTPDMREWTLATTNYGIEYVSAVQKDNIIATQFHPEKSGASGLALIRRFLEGTGDLPGEVVIDPPPTALAPRIIACLDVRANDAGDLVVTKGDQ